MTMKDRKELSHPYIPNSVEAVQKEMLREIGAGSIDKFFECIPEELRYKGRLAIKEYHPSEAGLKRHVLGMARRNRTDALSFLGGACWNVYVPATCDEINGRSEFLTAYAGDPYEDHGRFQALFEYTSMMAELLDFDVVNVPTYDGSQAAGTALRMAGRITNRDTVLVPETMNPCRMKVVETYLHPDMRVKTFKTRANFEVDLADLKAKLTDKTAAVLIENPTYLGSIEMAGEEIASAAHGAGALFVVLADPSSLGVLTAPSSYGADMACGDIQPLGMRPHFGGARGGFIAAPDDPKYVLEYPSRLFGIAPTSEGEWGFGDVAWERTSFAQRENAKEFVGTASALWGITAGVYLATMGPVGMEELGEGLMQRARYLAGELAKIGVKTNSGPFFREFVADFSGTGKRVADINRALAERDIFGGHDLGAEFGEDSRFVGKALYSVNETMTRADMDRLTVALKEILS